MIGGRFTTRELLRRTIRLLQLNSGQALFAVLILAGIGIALEQRPNAPFLGLIPFLVSIYFQYDLTTRALDGLGLLPGGFRTRRFAALLGLILLTRLPMLLGLIALVILAVVLRFPLLILFGFFALLIPVVILTVRWFLAVPVLVTEDVGIVEALRISWEETTGRFRPLLRLVLIVYLPPYLVAVLVAGRLGIGDLAPGSIVYNLVAYASLVAGWYAAVAAYAMRRGGSDGLAEIFA